MPLSELFSIKAPGIRLTWSGDTLAPKAIGTLVVTEPKGVEHCQVQVAGVARTNELTVGPALGEDREYIVWVEADKGVVELRHRDPRAVSRLSQRDGGRVLHGTISFRSAAGLSDFEILLNGKLVFSLTVEIFPTKLDYRSDFFAMLGDIQAVSTSLAIDLLTATYLPASALKRRSKGQGPEWIAVLEAMLGELTAAFRQIERAPIWTLEHEPAHLPLHRLRRVQPSISAAVVRRGLTSIREGKAHFDDARRIESRVPKPSLDGPEHRWLRQGLQVVLRRLKEASFALSQTHRGSESRAATLSAHLRKMIERITPLLDVEPLRDLRGGVATSFASLPLMTKAGYREAYAVLTMLDRGLLLDGPPLKADLRDIATLYEYWCFISLVRMAQEILGEKPVEQSLVRLASKGIRVDIQKGRQSAVKFRRADGLTVEIVYNRQFQASDAVLFDQRPDVVVTLRDPGGTELNLVVDAKYRVERSESRQKFGMIAPPEDAINALYRYRDAIIREAGQRTVVEAVAAYPASAQESLYFAESPLNLAIKTFGIGAIPFLPGNEEFMENWLRTAVERSGWETAFRNPDHLANLVTEEEERQGRRITLVDVPPAANRDARLEFFKSGWHYVPLATPKSRTSDQSAAQRRRLFAEYIALFDGKKVELFAQIIGTSIVRRKEISTPYPSSLSPEELCVLYQLGPPQILMQPIEVRSPMPNHRWTSELALRLARTTDELLVETADEWRLLRALWAKRRNPELERAEIKDERTGGHVNFVIGQTSVHQRTPLHWTVQRDGAIQNLRGIESVLEFLGQALFLEPQDNV